MSTVIKIVGQITLKALTDVESTTYYYLLQSSMAAAPSKPTTNPPTGGWSTTEPEFFIYMPTQDTTIISGKDYYTRSGEEGSYIYTKVLEPSIDDISNYYEKIYGDTRSLYVTVQTLYTDDTFDYSEPSLSSSYEAAKEAYNRAKTALDLAGDTNQYFWSLSSSYSTDVPAGVYVTHIPQSQFKSTPAQGNVLMQNTGLTIRNGAIALASLTGNALNFYSPTTHNSAVQLSGQALNFYSPSDDRLALSLDSSGLNFYGSSTVNPDASLTLNGLMLKKGGIKAGTDRDNGFVYLSSEDYQLKDATHNGLTINGHTPTAAGTDGKTVSDPAWREIIGTKFGVDSEGNLYARDANISGDLTITGHSNNLATELSTMQTDIENNLIYDHTYEIDSTDDTINSITFTAHVYRSGVDVTNEFDEDNFTWYYKNENAIDKLPLNNNTSRAIPNSGKTITISTTSVVTLEDVLSFGAEVIGCFVLTAAQNLLDNDGDTLSNSENQNLTGVTETGNSIRVRDLELTTTVNTSDKLLIVTSETEKIVNLSTILNLVPGSVTSVRVQAAAPVQSSVSTAQTSTLNTTISLADGYGDIQNPYGNKQANYILAGPISESGIPSFRRLTSADIPDLSSIYLTTEQDPIFSASPAASITSADINNWNTVLSSPAINITNTDINNWNSVSSKAEVQIIRWDE